MSNGNVANICVMSKIPGRKSSYLMVRNDDSKWEPIAILKVPENIFWEKLESALGMKFVVEKGGCSIGENSYTSPGNETIEDGFGSEWSAYCPTCKRKSMQIVRPGKVQCTYCG